MITTGRQPRTIQTVTGDIFCLAVNWPRRIVTVCLLLAPLYLPARLYLRTLWRYTNAVIIIMIIIIIMYSLSPHIHHPLAVPITKAVQIELFTAQILCGASSYR